MLNKEFHNQFGIFLKLFREEMYLRKKSEIVNQYRM